MTDGEIRVVFLVVLFILAIPLTILAYKLGFWIGTKGWKAKP